MIAKDKELPWVTRLLRWALSLCAVVYAVGFVANSFKNWFF